jgi:outer membrane receptor for ferric coprogen and ferric-rhodotorulic acid
MSISKLPGGARAALPCPSLLSTRLAAALALWPVLAGAQSAPADAASSGSLAPVTVEAAPVRDNLTEGTGSYTAIGTTNAATGLDLDLRETPQSVTVFTRQRIEDQGITSLGELMMQTPGVSKSQWGDDSSGYVTFYARGFAINNFQLNGVPTSSAALQGFTGLGSMDLSIYDQVTVVRGATGLLSGVGDPSASINLVRKRPAEGFRGAVGLTAGRWDRYRADADISTPLSADGRIRGRLVLAHDDNPTWVAHARNRRNVAYGVIEADLTPSTTVQAGVDHFRMRARGRTPHAYDYVDTAGQRTAFSRSSNASTPWSYNDLDRTTVFASLQHGFGNGWRAAVNLGHTKVDADQLYGVAAQAIRAGTNATGVTVGRSVNTPSQTTADLMLSGNYRLFGREHDLVLGANAYDLSSTDPAYGRASPTVPNVYDFDAGGSYIPLPTLTRNAIDTTNKRRQSGAYVATRLRPTDALSVIAGARVTNYRSLSITQSGRTEFKENGQVVPYLGVVYDLTDTLSAYASYTTIFNPQSNKDVNGNTLDPEEGDNIEVGLKGVLPGNRLNYSAAVFRARKDNLAVRDGNNLTPEGNTAYRAENDTTSKGFELEVSGELLPRWQIGGGFTRVATRSRDGARLNADFVPRNQFKLFTSYSGFAGSLSGLTVGGGLLWQSRLTDDDQPAYAQNSYAVVDLMARYAFTPRLSLAVNLNNVFDKTYRVTISQHTYGAPRNLSATLRYTF